MPIHERQEFDDFPRVMPTHAELVALELVPSARLRLAVMERHMTPPA